VVLAEDSTATGQGVALKPAGLLVLAQECQSEAEEAS